MEPTENEELPDLPDLQRMSSVNHPSNPEYKIVAEEVYKVQVQKK